MFKKPVDPYADLSDDEVEKKMDEFGASDFEEDDEKAMIQAALLTLMPAVIVTCLLFALLVFVIFKLLFK